MQMDSSWRGALPATLHCLTGFAVGEGVGRGIGTAGGLSNGTPIALASDTISIAIMEVVDNAILLLIPGAMDQTLSDIGFYVSLAVALLIAGAAAWPANHWL